MGIFFISFFLADMFFFFCLQYLEWPQGKNVVNKEKKQVVIGIECKMTTDAESSASERVSEPE